MAFPDNLTLITITGTYIDFQGNPLDGTVTFTPPSFLTDSETQQIVLISGVVGRVVGGSLLDVDGVGPLQLAATDDPDVTPTGWRYTVAEKLNGVTNRPSYWIQVPSAGGPIDLSTVINEPGPAAGTTQVVSGPPGVGVPAGGTTSQILAKTSGADYATGWEDAPAGSGGGLPTGGTAGQLILKLSSTNGDAGWRSLADAGVAGTGDPAMTNARTPTAHATTHATAGTDPITPASIGAATVDSVTAITAASLGAVATTVVGAALGVASLDGNGQVPAAQMPSAMVFAIRQASDGTWHTRDFATSDPAATVQWYAFAVGSTPPPAGGDYFGSLDVFFSKG